MDVVRVVMWKVGVIEDADDGEIEHDPRRRSLTSTAERRISEASGGRAGNKR